MVPLVDLGQRAPPAAWEAYFLIGVFPATSSLRWCKVQLFSGGKDPRRTCLSAVEGMDGEGRALFLAGRPAAIEESSRALGPGHLERAANGWEIRIPGLEWRGAYPDLRLSCQSPRIEASTSSTDRLVWIRAPGLLTYWSAFGTLEWESAGERAHGLGIVEHAWGADTRLPLARLVPARWHWDVLAFDAGGAGCAGLALGVAGRLFGVRAAGRLPGERFAIGRGPDVRILEWTEEAERSVPVRWTGRLRLGGRILDYEARATTPVAPVVPRGGFLGFSFESTRGKGSGFCEYAHRRPDSSALG